jgi:hypothetical protein
VHFLAALTGRYAANNVGAVLDHALCVGCAHFASYALDDYFCMFVDKNHFRISF